MNNQRNMILAVVLTAFVLIGWDFLSRALYPPHPHSQIAQTASPIALGSPTPGPTGKADPKTEQPTREGGLSTHADQATQAAALSRDLAPGAGARVAIAAPGLSGSINLTGGVIDDLTLNRHRAQLDKHSGPARMFSPSGTLAQHFAQFGWNVSGGTAAALLPNGETHWTAAANARLTPGTPVALTWTNAQGDVFTLTYSIDADYLITATQSVTNHGTAQLALQPFALLNRTDRTASQDGYQIHSGPFGAFDGGVAFAPKYKGVQDAGVLNNAGHTDWLGFTDIYWMSVLIPDASVGGSGASSDFRSLGGGIYRADLIYGPAIVAPGQTLTRTTRLFAGAKESVVLDRYEAAGIPHFGLAIDWGWFRFFEKPIFWLLRSLFTLTGNFGVAIILLTVIVRGVMFPIAQRQFASMAAMKAIQPKIKALQVRYKDDKPKLQEATMALYKEEKVNPLAGCVPIFLQIPIFFALFKVLTVSIEMRFQPFVLWLRDLSAPDSSHFLNLFGLIAWNPTGYFGIGVLALLLGVTMWGQFKLQPQAADPAQQQMMSIMPWFMMFIMATYASGLLLYWITSNLLTILQQTYLHRRHPQLRLQANKDAVDARRAAERK